MKAEVYWTCSKTNLNGEKDGRVDCQRRVCRGEGRKQLVAVHLNGVLLPRMARRGSLFSPVWAWIVSGIVSYLGLLFPRLPYGGH